MSGTIEQLHAKVDAILAILQAGGTAATAPQPPAQTFAAPLATTPAPVAPAAPAAAPAALTMPPAGAGQFPAVSAEQITALITPHVADPNLKAALQQQMAAMGIGALPDAQPHQYGELYTRFQNVITQFTAAPAAPVAAATPASII